MAINITTNPSFTGKITPADANYPYGSARNETIAGAKDGTPYIKIRSDDLFGFQQWLLTKAGITPNGSADNVNLCQYGAALSVLGMGFPYLSYVDYPAGSLVTGSDGGKYSCRIANGPATTVVDPVGDVTGTWVTSGLPVIRKFEVSDNYVKPPGLSYIKAYLTGAGGGGQGTLGLYTSSQPGAAGGTCIQIIPASDLASSEPIVIGAGGTGGTQGTPATAGGNSFFRFMQAFGGGAGGIVSPASDTVAIGGNALGGDINLPGGDGCYQGTSATGKHPIGTRGGASFWGGGSAGSLQVADSNVKSPRAYGSGGGGWVTLNSLSDLPGGAGADGVLIVEEYYL